MHYFVAATSVTHISSSQAESDHEGPVIVVVELVMEKQVHILVNTVNSLQVKIGDSSSCTSLSTSWRKPDVISMLPLAILSRKPTEVFLSVRIQIIDQLGGMVIIL